MDEGGALLDRLISIVHQHVRDFESKAENLGVRLELTEVSYDDPSRMEVTVYFWRGSELVDVIELPLSSSGKPLDASEAAEWLTKSFGEALDRIS